MGAFADINKGLLDQCDVFTQATGFHPRPLPKLSVAGQPVEWSAQLLTRERRSSELQLSHFPLRHLYGTGIAFPEDLGCMKASPTETGVGWTFAGTLAARCAANLER